MLCLPANRRCHVHVALQRFGEPGPAAKVLLTVSSPGTDEQIPVAALRAIRHMQGQCAAPMGGMISIAEAAWNLADHRTFRTSSAWRRTPISESAVIQRWAELWSAGHSVSGLTTVSPVAELVRTLRYEFNVSA